MIKKILLIVLLLAGVSFGQATNWNINGRPTADWFSGMESTRDIPLQWMRAIDPLIASAGGSGGTGNNYYVDSNVSTAGDGSSWTNAVAILDTAVALCTANNGDTIHVKEGHAETLAGADGVDIDVAGVTVIGYGDGNEAPEFSFTATGSEFVIGAGGVTVSNLRFIAGVSAVTMGITSAAVIA